MRAGPLSNTKVIELLNGCFVPVYTVNEEYTRDGIAPAEEKAAREHIFREGHAAKKSVGSVHVYVLRPDGTLLDTLHVAEAAKVKKLIALLERTAAELKVAKGAPVVPPSTQSPKPVCQPGELALHLTARSIDGRGAWNDFPVENWIILDANDALLPAKGEVAVGRSWNIPAPVATKLLTHFYPATENNDVAKNRFENLALSGTIVSLEKDVARARIEGAMKMAHSFYHKEDGKTVEATIIGYLDFEPGSGKVRTTQIVTERATYGGGNFAVAVRSVE
jgi:hypothetical protein